jgi:hypothetical protein
MSAMCYHRYFFLVAHHNQSLKFRPNYGSLQRLTCNSRNRCIFEVLTVHQDEAVPYEKQ